MLLDKHRCRADSGGNNDRRDACLLEIYVSYKHLTLPTNSEIEDSEGALSRKTKRSEEEEKNGTKVNKNERLAVQKNNSILIKTDKVKYNQQDDIVLTLESEKDIKDQTIAVCKNGEILKLVTTDEEQVVVNLEDNYGLIDFYVLKNYNTKYKNQQTISKRTVFVKPNKALNVQVKTDSEIYKPKDNMNLNINLTDETGKTVDGALLVSILDEANLAIKDNDLSIDNIKISLQDIMLSDKLDGATFLTNVIDDKSESTLMAMRLKQESKDPNIAKETYSSIDSKEKSASILLIGIIVFILILLIYFSIKKEGVREALKHIIAFVGVNFVTLLILYLLDDIFSELDLNKRNNILKYLDSSLQVIVTTTDIENIDNDIRNKANVYRIDNGKLFPGK